MKKIPRWAVYLSLPLALLLSVLFLQWESISYYTARKVAQIYAHKAGIRIAAGTISGTPFHHTTLENVTVQPAEGQAAAYIFTARAITCSYNLWDLKEGYGVFLQGLACAATDPVFSYAFKDTIREEEPDQGPSQVPLPVLFPELELHNGTVILSHAGWIAEMRGINSGLRPAADGSQELQLQAENFQFNQDGVTRIDTDVSALLHYDDAKLSIASLELGRQEISASGFIDLGRIDKGYAEFAADLVFGQSRLNMAGSLDNRLLKVQASTGNFDSAELQKRLGGSGWNISGAIRGDADLVYTLGAKEDLKGSFALEMQEGELQGVRIESFSLAGSFAGAIFTLSAAEARTPGNHILISDLSVPLALLQEGEVSSITMGTKARFVVDAADFAALMKLARVGEDVLPAGARPDSLTIQGSLEKGSIYLDEAIAVAPGSRLVIKHAVIPVPAAGYLPGPVPIKLAARFESNDVQSLTWLFGDIPVTGQAAADMSIAGSTQEAKGTITLTGENLRFSDLQAGSLAMQGEFQLVGAKTGTISAAQFRVTRMTQTNASGSLALLSPITGSWQPARFAMAGTLQIDGQAEVAIDIAKSAGKETRVEISGRGLSSEGWLGNFMDKGYFFHGADIDAVLAGSQENRQLQLTGSIAEAGVTGMDFPLTGSFRLQYSARGIEISTFTVKSHERNEFKVSGFLPYDPLAQEPFLAGELALDGHVDFPDLEDIALFLEPLGLSRGSVVMDVALSGSWQQPAGHILLKAEGVEPPEMLKEYTDAPMDVNCDLAAGKGRILLNSASLVSSDYMVQAAGSWQHGFTLKELLQKNRAELGGEITADAAAQLKNLNFLKKKFPWLRRFDGDTQIKLHVSGPAADPSLQGSFFLKDGEISHTFNLPMLSEVNLQGEFDEHSLTITGMQAEVGGSPVVLDGRISRRQDGVDVNLGLAGKNVLLLRNNDMRLRGDVELDIAGPLEHLAISGTTALTSGYYTRNIDFLGKIGTSTAPVSEGGSFLFSFEEEPLKNASFDIRITTVEPFRIRNNLVRGALRPELSLKGTGELPFLVGTVYIDPSRVLLPSGRLQVQSGLVRFLENNPDRPQLDLLANSKVLDYDINVVIQGPLDDPVITLSSSPALPNDDLLLLLLTGQPPKEEATQGALGRGATNVMVYLGRDFLNKWLEDESGTSDETILDRFELDYGRGVTKSGEQTIETTFRLSEQAVGTKRVYYLSGEKDRYDAYNLGLKVVFRFE